MRAVTLLSGGLDSLLAARVMLERGHETHPCNRGVPLRHENSCTVACREKSMNDSQREHPGGAPPRQTELGSSECGPECECFKAPREQLTEPSPKSDLAPVYLDHAATTPVRPEVIEAMLPYFALTFGNASSIHMFGQEARKALESARETVAHCIGARPEEIYFTGGGTESDNLALQGVARANSRKGKHLITSQIEHHAVLTCCSYLEKEGFEVTYSPVDRLGVVKLEALEAAVRADTILFSVMLANNETGTLEPISEIAAMARGKGIPVHTDAVQAVGKIPVNVDALRVDLLSISAHKMHGPKGVGALYVRRGVRVDPLFYGGHHERTRRPGTENVAGVVGFAKAMELATEELPAASKQLTALRDRLERGIRERIPRVRLNGHPAERLPSILNVSFDFVEGESLLLALDLQGIAVSTGSACTSGSLEPSHVLQAMGLPRVGTQGSLRFSIGRDNTEDEIDFVVGRLAGVVHRLRRMSPLHTEGV